MKTVELPASINVLGEINVMLEQSLTGPLAPLLFKTQLVVEELLSNICFYAYDGKEGKAGFACGTVNFDGRQCVMLQLTDSGKPYDPFAETAEPDLDAPIEERSVGGLGVHLVRELASHYTYIRIDGCNQSQIIFEIGDSEAENS